MPNLKLESTELVVSSCHRISTPLQLDLTHGNANQQVGRAEQCIFKLSVCSTRSGRVVPNISTLQCEKSICMLSSINMVPAFSFFWVLKHYWDFLQQAGLCPYWDMWPAGQDITGIVGIHINTVWVCPTLASFKHTPPHFGPVSFPPSAHHSPLQKTLNQQCTFIVINRPCCIFAPGGFCTMVASLMCLIRMKY